MKTISDIRLYKSSKSEKHASFAGKALNLSVRRIAMKLREQGFSLGGFDHLYLNFTTDRPEGTIELIDVADRYHPWYRYCDIGISQDDYGCLENDDYICRVHTKLTSALLSLSIGQEGASDIILTAVSEAQKGSQMLMRFKEKKTATGIATVYLRLSDNGEYRPLLCVTDANGSEKLRADLPPTVDLNTVGEIQLSNKKVTVKPRKNALAKPLEPISFEF